VVTLQHSKVIEIQGPARLCIMIRFTAGSKQSTFSDRFQLTSLRQVEGDILHCQWARRCICKTFQFSAHRTLPLASLRTKIAHRCSFFICSSPYSLDYHDLTTVYPIMHPTKGMLVRDGIFWRGCLREKASIKSHIRPSSDPHQTLDFSNQRL
jgi:hypothetical protein